MLRCLCSIDLPLLSCLLLFTAAMIKCLSKRRIPFGQKMSWTKLPWRRYLIHWSRTRISIIIAIVIMIRMLFLMWCTVFSSWLWILMHVLCLLDIYCNNRCFWHNELTLFERFALRVAIENIIINLLITNYCVS